jgi:putative transposase
MPRPMRLEYDNAYYHIMNRGWRRGNIFTKDNEFKAFLNTLRDSCKQYGVFVNAYCIMSNHYHLLVHTPQGNLSQFMRQVNGVYAQKYNIMNKTEGAVFRGRYKSILIQDGLYLLRVMRYIHLNPIKACIGSNLSAYRWSSHSNYQRRTDNAWLKVSPVLSLIKESRSDCDTYMQYMRSQEDQELEAFYRKKNLEAVLGEIAFVDYVYQKNYERLNGVADLSNKRLEYGYMITRQIIGKVREYFNVCSDDLYVKSRGMENVPLQCCVYLIRNKTQLTFNEIAKELRFSSNRSVESCYSRFNSKLNKRNDLEKNVRELKKGCSYAVT